MKQYLDLLQHVLDHGVEKHDRTGVGTLSSFAHTMRFDLQEGFPLVTTKKMFFKGVAAELLWFLSGSTNINDLPDYVKAWWEPWADEDGSVGRIYGAQYRESDGYGVLGVDQLLNTVESLKKDPDSRRHVITLWHPYDMKHLQKLNLPCCHGTVIQFYVAEGKLSCATHQRSADVPVGLPVNIASYALLTHMMAHQVGLDVGILNYTTGDTHIYKNQIEGVKEQLLRTPLKLPKLEILRKPDHIDGYQVEDFKLVDYDYYPAIKFPVAV